MINLESKMLDISSKVNRTMEVYFSGLKGIDAKLLEAMKYSVLSGGKRLRPCILVMFYELCGGKLEEIYQVACAVEMIHTYSLIHDDLPCMDNDKIRRGKECTHIVYGEDMALLAGDALITQAFELLLSEGVVEKFGRKTVIDAVRMLSNAAGSCGMVSGQATEISVDKNNYISEKTLIDIYRKKTGNLFVASAKIGTICAGTADEYVNFAGEYGKCFGIAFQLRDDLLDMSQDGENKATYVSIYGKEKSEQMINLYSIQAVKCLEEFENNSPLLKELLKKVSFRGE